MFNDYTVSGVVTDDGRLELDDRAAFSKAMRHFKHGRVTVRIETDRGRRTTQQNRYYRLVLGLISDDTGHEPDELHELFKHKFLPAHTVTVLGEDVNFWTTTLEDYDQFWQYVERIRRFALIELQIETPDPDPALRGRRQARTKKQEAA